MPTHNPLDIRLWSPEQMRDALRAKESTGNLTEDLTRAALTMLFDRLDALERAMAVREQADAVLERAISLLERIDDQGRPPVAARPALEGDWIPAEQAADLIGILASTVRERIRDGAIPGEKRYGKWFVRRGDAENYKAHREGRPLAPQGLKAVKSFAGVMVLVLLGLGGTVSAQERHLTCALEVGATKCIIQDRAWTGTKWTDRVTMEPPPPPATAPEMTYHCPANRRMWLRICQEGTGGLAGRKCQKEYGHWCTTKPEDLK